MRSNQDPVNQNQIESADAVKKKSASKTWMKTMQKLKH